MAAYAIKTKVDDPGADIFNFIAVKTMYGGKRIAAGDLVYIFASENEGGAGLVARGMAIRVEAVAKKPGVDRQTPRVSLVVKRNACAHSALGRRELKSFDVWDDGRPQTELNFKFYRQATDKLVGVSDAAAAFLARFF